MDAGICARSEGDDMHRAFFTVKIFLVKLWIFSKTLQQNVVSLNGFLFVCALFWALQVFLQCIFSPTMCTFWPPPPVGYPETDI